MIRLIYLLTTLIYLCISVIRPVEAGVQTGAKTSISATIPGKIDIRLYGYTAPNSIVRAESIRVFTQVSSDRTGYFVIDPLTLSMEAHELCLTTIDSEYRYGFPICIGVPFVNVEEGQSYEIGPVLLSPTFSINNNKIIQSQKVQGQASGVTIPNSVVDISFFDNARKILSLIPPVEAKSISRISTFSDKNGSFSINLPSTQALTYKVMAKAYYNPAQDGKVNSPTPNSLTLTYSVISYTIYWLINILPRLIFLCLFILCLLGLLWWEKRTGKGHLAWAKFIETRWKPFEVRMRLKHRRIWYNFQKYLQSDRI